MENNNYSASGPPPPARAYLDALNRMKRNAPAAAAPINAPQSAGREGAHVKTQAAQLPSFSPAAAAVLGGHFSGQSQASGPVLNNGLANLLGRVGTEPNNNNGAGALQNEAFLRKIGGEKSEGHMKNQWQPPTVPLPAIQGGEWKLPPDLNPQFHQMNGRFQCPPQVAPPLSFFNNGGMMGGNFGGVPAVPPVNFSNNGSRMAGNFRGNLGNNGCGAGGSFGMLQSALYGNMASVLPPSPSLPPPPNFSHIPLADQQKRYAQESLDGVDAGRTNRHPPFPSHPIVDRQNHDAPESLARVDAERMGQGRVGAPLGLNGDVAVHGFPRPPPKNDALKSSFPPSPLPPPPLPPPPRSETKPHTHAPPPPLPPPLPPPPADQEEPEFDLDGGVVQDGEDPTGATNAKKEEMDGSYDEDMSLSSGDDKEKEGGKDEENEPSRSPGLKAAFASFTAARETLRRKRMKVKLARQQRPEGGEPAPRDEEGPVMRDRNSKKEHVRRRKRSEEESSDDDAALLFGSSDEDEDEDQPDLKPQSLSANAALPSFEAAKEKLAQRRIARGRTARPPLGDKKEGEVSRSAADSSKPRKAEVIPSFEAAKEKLAQKRMAQGRLRRREGVPQPSGCPPVQKRMAQERPATREGVSHPSGCPPEQGGGSDDPSSPQHFIFNPPSPKKGEHDSEEYESSDEGSVFSLTDDRGGGRPVKPPPLSSASGSSLKKKTASAKERDKKSFGEAGYTIKKKGPRMTARRGLICAQAMPQQGSGPTLADLQLERELASLRRQKLDAEKAAREAARRSRTISPIVAAPAAAAAAKVVTSSVGKKNAPKVVGKTERVLDPNAFKKMSATKEGWRASLKEMQWQKGLGILEKYMQKHKSCDVPHGHSLSSWIQKQRKECRIFVRDANDEQGEPSEGQLQRHAHVLQLEHIGFDWGKDPALRGDAVREALAVAAMGLSPPQREGRGAEQSLSATKKRKGAARDRGAARGQKRKECGELVFDSISTKKRGPRPDDCNGRTDSQSNDNGPDPSNSRVIAMGFEGRPGSTLPEDGGGDGEFVDDKPDSVSWREKKKWRKNVLCGMTADQWVDLMLKVKTRCSSTLQASGSTGSAKCWTDLEKIPTERRDAKVHSNKREPPALSPSENTELSAGRLLATNGNIVNQGITTKKNIKQTSAAGISSMKLLARSPLRATRSDPEKAGLQVGDRVYAAWQKGRNKLPFYFPGVIEAYSIAEKRVGRSDETLFYDVHFEDGDRLKGIEEVLVIPRKKYLEHGLKPNLQVGDEVYAAWWENNDRSTSASWFPGVIRGCREAEFGGPHGPIRLFDIKFDDGDELDSIEDYFVMKKVDYLLSTRKRVDRDDGCDSDSDSDDDGDQWIGVRNKFDENSVDEYFRTMGWYVATIEGQEQSFSRLSDALRAYDVHTVRRKGAKTKTSDINLLDEWAFPSPFGICPPVHIGEESCGSKRLVSSSSASPGSENKLEVPCPSSTPSGEKKSAVFSPNSSPKHDDESELKETIISPKPRIQISPTDREDETGHSRRVIGCPKPKQGKETKGKEKSNSVSFASDEAPTKTEPHLTSEDSESNAEENTKELLGDTRSTTKAISNLINLSSPKDTDESSTKFVFTDATIDSLPVSKAKGEDKSNSVSLPSDDIEPEPLVTDSNDCLKVDTNKRSTNHTNLTIPKTATEGSTTNVINTTTDAPPASSSKIVHSKSDLNTCRHATLSSKESRFTAVPAKGFPENWTARRISRSGNGSDTYFYSPVEGYKFRSKPEVERFLNCLKRTRGDETMAIQEFHSSAAKRKRMPKKSPRARKIPAQRSTGKTDGSASPQPCPVNESAILSSFENNVADGSEYDRKTKSETSEYYPERALLGDTRSTTRAISDLIDRTNPKSFTQSLPKNIVNASPARSVKPTLSANESKFPAMLAEGIPSNWTVCQKPRAISTKGSKRPKQRRTTHIDRYYYSPKMKYKFRSKLEVSRFLDCLKRTNGDEVLAMEELRGSAKHNKKTPNELSTRSTTPTSPYKILEYVDPPKTVVEEGKNVNNGKEEGAKEVTKEESTLKPGVSLNGHVKPIIKKGEKVYACWSGGDGHEWFPGRVWDIKEYPGAEYGPEKKYDIVFDDGDTESSVGEIWITKKEDYETCLQKPEESDWIGVNNVRFSDSKDEYARMIGWYETCLGGTKRAYSSLTEALRAHDKHIIEMRGRSNISVTDLNFPDEHELQNSICGSEGKDNQDEETTTE